MDRETFLRYIGSSARVILERVRSDFELDFDIDRIDAEREPGGRPGVGERAELVRAAAPALGGAQ